MEILFYGKFILLKNLRKRIRSPLLSVKCIGAKDGEQLELYINGKMSGVYTVRDGAIAIRVSKNNNYRIASPNAPYGVKFNTTDAPDNENDILVFQSFHEATAEFKNLYRIIEHLCSVIEKQQNQINSLMGYQTE